MIYDRWKIKMCGRIQAVIVLLLLISAPCLSFAAEQFNTIQIGSHLSEDRSRQQYNSVLEMLNEEERDSLRIEKIGKYYVLRLGTFASSSEAEGLLQTIKSAIPDARIMKAYLNNNRLVEMYSSTTVEEPVPEVPEPKVEPSIVPVEKKAELPRVEVADSTAKAPVGVKLPATNAGSADMTKSVAVGEEAASMDETSQIVISDNLLITFISALFLIMLGFYIRALARTGSFASEEEQLAGAVAAEELATEKGSVTAEAGEEISVATGTDFADSQDVEWSGNKEENLVGGKQDNRGSEDIVAANLVTEIVVDEAETVEEVPAPAIAPTYLQSIVRAGRREESLPEEGLDSLGEESVRAAELVEHKDIKSTEMGGEISIATGTAPMDLPDAESSDSKEDSPVKDKKENRVRSAVEAAMLVSGNKR